MTHIIAYILLHTYTKYFFIVFSFIFYFIAVNEPVILIGQFQCKGSWDCSVSLLNIAILVMILVMLPLRDFSKILLLLVT